MSTSPIPPLNIQVLTKEAQNIYESLRNELEPSQNGKYIAIDINSKKYFLGETREQAVADAKKRFPNAFLFVRRIGALEKVARRSPTSAMVSNNYARIF